MNSQKLAIVSLLLSATLVGCASTAQYHGELYFEQIVGHQAVTDQERADSHACAQQAGLGTASHIIFSGVPMALVERSKMKSCFQDHGYEVK